MTSRNATDAETVMSEGLRHPIKKIHGVAFDAKGELQVVLDFHTHAIPIKDCDLDPEQPLEFHSLPNDHKIVTDKIVREVRTDYHKYHNYLPQLFYTHR